MERISESVKTIPNVSVDTFNELTHSAKAKREYLKNRYDRGFARKIEISDSQQIFEGKHIEFFDGVHDDMKTIEEDSERIYESMSGAASLLDSSEFSRRITNLTAVENVLREEVNIRELVRSSELYMLFYSFSYLPVPSAMYLSNTSVVPGANKLCLSSLSQIKTAIPFSRSTKKTEAYCNNIESNELMILADGVGRITSVKAIYSKEVELLSKTIERNYSGTSRLIYKPITAKKFVIEHDESVNIRSITSVWNSYAGTGSVLIKVPSFPNASKIRAVVGGITNGGDVTVEISGSFSVFEDLAGDVVDIEGGYTNGSSVRCYLSSGMSGTPVLKYVMVALY
ncbi:MAG TPA: hypothetical protein P5539_08900 [Mesotoga sp.]|nr:hypothetical protein [Mesotoga sp.]